MAHRPRPSDDAALEQLRALLLRPCSTTVEGASLSSLVVSLQRPEPASAAVLFVSEVVAGVSRAVAVVKERTTWEKAVVEHMNYLLSRELGFGVVAPCLPVVFRGAAEDGSECRPTVYSFCLRAMEEYSNTAEGDSRVEWYGTIEACQRLLPHSDLSSPPPSWLLHLQTLPMGCATLNQALDLMWLAPGAAESHPTQSANDLQQLLRAVSQPAFEMLSLFCLLTCQLDATAENLLLTVEGEGCLRLVLIDTTWSLPLEDDLPFHLKDRDPARRYWYPAWVCLPHALRPLSTYGREFLARLQPTAASTCAEWTTVTGSPYSKLRMDGVDRRLDRMRALLAADPHPTLRALAFDTLPFLARDFAPFLAQEGVTADQLDRLAALLG
eukprot:EG_transcript_13962